jgi:hypothetical protein
MNAFRNSLRTLALVAFMLTITSLAHAQASRTWVSGVGDDVNPCSRTAPCKTFAGAISKTFINGEIDALDPAGFGAITITKSITIDGTGTLAAILASGVNGVNINIAINANDPLRSVTLRGLSITGSGASGTVGTRTGVQGINVNTNGANTVFIEDCVVFHFSQNGYNQVNTTASSTNVFIKNSVFRDNGGAGVNVSNTNAANLIRVVADHSHFTGNANGVNGGANSRITATDCSLSGNSNAGALSRSLTAGLNSVVTLVTCEVANNVVRGVEAGGGGALATSFIVLDGNNISGSGTSAVLVGTSGEIDTFGNNHFFGNNNNTCTGCTAIAPANQ